MVACGIYKIATETSRVLNFNHRNTSEWSNRLFCTLQIISTEDSEESVYSVWLSFSAYHSAFSGVQKTALHVISMHAEPRATNQVNYHVNHCKIGGRNMTDLIPCLWATVIVGWLNPGGAHSRWHFAVNTNNESRNVHCALKKMKLYLEIYLNTEDLENTHEQKKKV